VNVSDFFSLVLELTNVEFIADLHFTVCVISTSEESFRLQEDSMLVDIRMRLDHILSVLLLKSLDRVGVVFSVLARFRALGQKVTIGSIFVRHKNFLKSILHVSTLEDLRFLKDLSSLVLEFIHHGCVQSDSLVVSMRGSSNSERSWESHDSPLYSFGAHSPSLFTISDCFHNSEEVPLETL
jgi:hypothetical protein